MEIVDTIAIIIWSFVIIGVIIILLMYNAMGSLCDYNENQGVANV